jgi:flagellar biosynthesis protein FlhG
MKSEGHRSVELRLLQTGKRTPQPSRRPRTRSVAVVSGKGGVGKTTLIVNLAVAVRRLGKRVLLVDGDLGMGNADLLLGQIPRYTMHDVVLGERSAEEILLTTPDGIHLMPGSSGVEEMANLDELRCERLLCSISEIEHDLDLILIDTASGLHRTATHLARAADEILIVTTPEPTAFTDAYATLRVLRNHPGSAVPWIIVNQARDAGEARATAEKIRSVSKRFLTIEPQFLGFVLEDPAVGKAVRRQEPLMRLYPRSQAAGCIEGIAARLVAGPEEEPEIVCGPGRSRKRVVNMEDAPA